nr:aromatic amino acid lyase [Indiicoccus explosivorum]
MAIKNIQHVTLGGKISLEEFVAVARLKVPVHFSEEYRQRVEKSSRLVQSWINEGKVMYGVNTGFGALSTQLISAEETALLQRNILVSHATSVGEPLEEETVRAILLMVLQNVGQGFSGVRLETLDMYRRLLNERITPYVPGEGSVGYLSVEAHIALVLIGQGKAYVDGELLPASEALSRGGWSRSFCPRKKGWH